MRQSSNKNRTLQWEEESSSADLRPDTAAVKGPVDAEVVRPQVPRLEVAGRKGSRAESSRPESSKLTQAQLIKAQLTQTQLSGADPTRPDTQAGEPEDLDEAEPRNRWWRPTGTGGRIVLGVGLFLVLGGLIATAALIKRHLSEDERFQLASAENVLISGNLEVNRAEILPLFQQDIGRSILSIPLAERRRQLEKFPWIERVTVMRVWPNHIRIAINERTPVAFVRQGNHSGDKDQQVGLVDASGVFLAMSPALMAQHHYSFPVVTGLDAVNLPAERSKRMAVYQRLMRELDAGGNKFSDQISEVDLTNVADARVLIPEQGTDILVHLGKEYFLQTYRIYKAHIAEWKQQFPRLYAVDLRYDQQAVLKQTEGPPPPLWSDESDNAPPDGHAALGTSQADMIPAAGKKSKKNKSESIAVEPVESAAKKAQADAELAKKSKGLHFGKSSKSLLNIPKRSTNAGSGQ